MMSLYGEADIASYLAMAFYSLIFVPFLKISNVVLRICRFMVDPHNQPAESSSQNPDWELDLPVAVFEELAETRDGEITCSICLEELEGADSVNKLPDCGHLFHAACMERWLDTCQFTCPLCRSSLLRRRLRSPPCKPPREPLPFCVDLPHLHHS